MSTFSSQHKSSLRSLFDSAVEKISHLTGKNFDHLFGKTKGLNNSDNNGSNLEDSYSISS